MQASAHAEDAAVVDAAAAVPAAMLPDGTLAREASSPRVYYIDHGTKSWIDSEDAFLRQGFRWSDVIKAGNGDLERYTEIEPITLTSPAGREVRSDLLPDLTTPASTETFYSVQGGRTLLKFTALFGNVGKGAFELDSSAEDAQPGEAVNARQRVFRADGTSWDRQVGMLFWHGIHEHYHYDDFGEYRLELIRPAVGTASETFVVDQKTTYCMRDDTMFEHPSEAPRQPMTYGGCTQDRQGVSVGWYDVYLATLPDQYFDVTDLPAGLYRLSFDLDPHRHFLESRRDNNVSMAFFELDPAARTRRLIAAAAPFVTDDNVFADGMLLRAEGDARIFVTRADKVRHMRTEDAFRSYGFDRDSVIVLPRAIMDAIPHDMTVRVKGTSAVYRINDAGYRHRLIAPSVVRSYGPDIADITQEEFESYIGSELIQREGDADVYLAEGATKRRIGPRGSLAALGYDPAAIHIVTDSDFDAHVTRAVPAPAIARTVEAVANGLDVPWEVVALPDGDMLVTERTGTLRRIGKDPAVITVPGVLHTGEGGLMGMALHPQFAQNQLLYLYFTTSENGQHNRVSRFRLDEAELKDETIIIDGIPSAIYHDGGRIAFGPDSMLYITTGDAQDPSDAQDLGSLAGKTLRLTADGGIPSDNPFGTAVWSYGHRNAQGIAWDDKGRMWETEHGPSGNDELNLVEKGKNYGWPTIQGSASRVGMQTPVIVSGPDATWAPAGIAFADGKLFFSGLRGASLYEATPHADGTATDLQAHFGGVYGRLRAVVLSPDGNLLITTSNRDGRGTVRDADDKILKVHPEYFRD